MRIVSKKYVISLLFLLLIGVFLVVGLNHKESEFSCNDCNLIIIATTNISAEHMSGYGYEKNTTPNIDKFANEALLFKNTFAHTSWTLPSATSVFTSQYPYTHGTNNREEKKAIVELTLADILKSSGYKTAAFTGGGDYDRVYGLNKGFDTYIDSDYFAGLKDRVPLAIEWLKDNQDDKFFLYVQGFDSHCPFNPPAPYDTMFIESKNMPIQEDAQTKRNFCLRGFKDDSDGKDIYRTYHFQQGDPIPVDLTGEDVEYLTSQYDGEIAMTDDSVGMFLDYLKSRGLLKNTVVVIYSEHGEMFGKHGRFGRAGTNRGTLYDEVVHVPLVIKNPKAETGKKIDGLVQLIDILPTMLNMLSIKFPNTNNFQGKSLFPLILNDEEVNRYVYAGAEFGKDVFDFFSVSSVNESVRDKKWKLIHEVLNNSDSEETWELYDISTDLQEQKNLINQEQEIFDELKGKLVEWRSDVVVSDYETVDETLEPAPADLIEESRKRGYF
ncbi:sulfatase [Candidatus Kaiserbacteria bacterium]|nr:sulfatase [Candidatus Kaiserbacteria bacterium]